MHRDTEKLEMRRKLFKKLKERKLFTKYCLAIATAFSDNALGYYFEDPHTRADNYIKEWENKSEHTIDGYLYAIANEWSTFRNIAIQY